MILAHVPVVFPPTPWRVFSSVAQRRPSGPTRSAWRSSAPPSDSRRASPRLSVFLRRHVVRCPQMPLQHFQLLAILEADEVVGRDRLLRFRRFWLTIQIRERIHEGADGIG